MVANEAAATSVPLAAVSELARGTWSRTCFYSSPIQDEGSEQREHADGFLNTLVRPAVASVDKRMKVVRADELAYSPISSSVYEHVLRAGLLIADLSFHNPNVFHEIGLRQLTGKPYVFVSREEDDIPANLKDERVVQIDTSGPWKFRSQLRSRKRDVADQVRWALSPDWHRAHPIQARFPDFREYMD
jgi:hypothetical protein